ncbi:MAG TPA: tetratricopeptide repeat protein [Pirellulales bacterium]|nr:tetratricopeptide repeat protein [Pirellulales bacterium]
MTPGEENPSPQRDSSNLEASSSNAASVVHCTTSGWIGNLDQAGFEVAFYERILQRQPHDVRVLKLLGELYARQGRHDLALVIDQQLAGLLPDDSLVRYNLACSLAMQDAPDAALVALASALELGYNDFSHLEVDPDLNRLRGLPEFQALLRKYGLDG